MALRAGEPQKPEMRVRAAGAALAARRRLASCRLDLIGSSASCDALRGLRAGLGCRRRRCWRSARETVVFGDRLGNRAAGHRKRDLETVRSEWRSPSFEQEGVARSSLLQDNYG